MRKPRDIDSELKVLEAKAKTLKDRRVRQLGELVIATGADALDTDLLTGALLGVVATKDTIAKEGWRKAGAAFFQRGARKAATGTDRGAANETSPDSHAASA
ncbi:conjugal transfer protein TraD [Sphingopyxis sp. Root214]|uniref:conjugal transfer protein TraD n=1 Tax=unclassified Sphingopyxis TaxID=2614943 RepID=UPI0006F62A8A|nr:MULTISPECIES: conjugal transfer protein TraD [unclassified Sphingopyxis]KQZ73882.1 conjugal transfer protein TraD [Sphingopyxis sp. Root154]KRC08022.1 conjugal transfer protein TraD [Sphingopyxis sp. Root214]